MNTIHLIPCPIAESAMHTIPDYVKSCTHSVKYFIVERSKTGRQFLKALDHPLPMNEINVEQIDKHDDKYILGIAREWINAGIDFGIISEAGCPGIADPGADIVKLGHELGSKIVPLVGPSSILLALMASGMNGQQFTFHGYLPNKKDALSKKLKSISNGHLRQAHIFIETPYRNKSLYDTLLRSLPNNTKLCIAADVTGKNEYIKTHSISEWKQLPFPFQEKIPAIFILG